MERDKSASAASGPSLTRALRLIGEGQQLVNVWLLIKPYWRMCAVVAIVTQALNMLRSTQPWLTHFTIDWYVVPKTTDGLIWLVAVFVGLRLTIFGLFYYQKILLTTLRQKITATLRIRLHQKLYDLDCRYFETTPKGQLTALFTLEAESIGEMLTTFNAQVIGDGVIVLFTVATLLIIDPYLTFILALTIIPLLPLFRFFRGSIRQAQMELKEKFAKLNAYLHEYMAGVTTIQMFNAETHAMRDFEEVNRELGKGVNRGKFRQVRVTALIELMIALLLTVLVLYGGWRMLQPHGQSAGGSVMTVGAFAAFLQAVLQLLEPMRNLSNNFSLLQNGMASMKRISEILERPPALVAPVAPASQVIVENVKERRRGIRTVSGLIEFDKVSFAYRGEDWVLKDLSLRIEPGESVAIVGSTGAGKTTIANLLLRFYDVQRGKIMLDGIDLREMEPADLRRHFAVAMQDAFLFKDTIRYNILLGQNELDDDHMKEIVARTGAAGFIENLPGNFETVVGGFQDSLSLGQKQLISLARTVCRKPPIFILDEICHAVDSETESLINETIASMVKGSTSILISHRLSMIRHVDRVALLHKGRVFEEGSHDELLIRGGLYRQLYQAWV
jgi:ATP-binding cassette, subfamily B, multidrug efflux pump